MKTTDMPVGVEAAWPARPAQRSAERLLVAIIIALMAAGVWQAGKGVWIQAKAHLAQLLIASAWQRAVAGETRVRPWPWADTSPVAKLTIPRLGVERYVLSGADGSALAFGPGHATGTALPGGRGNSVIAGHRDTHFDFMRRVRIGDELIVERADGVKVRYRVGTAEILDRRDIWVMDQAGPSRLTLVTCYPFDALDAGGPLRYVVVAEAA